MMQRLLPLFLLGLLASCKGYEIDTWKQSSKAEAARCDRSVRTADGMDPSYDPCTRNRLTESESQADRFQRYQKAPPLD